MPKPVLLGKVLILASLVANSLDHVECMYIILFLTCFTPVSHNLFLFVLRIVCMPLIFTVR